MPTNRNPPTEKEMAELRAASKCFMCKEVGHILRNCPTNSTMKGNRSKLPGIPNYSMQMDLLEDISDVEVL